MARDEIAQEIENWAVAQGVSIPADRSLTLAIDSLDAITLAAHLEERFGVRLSDEIVLAWPRAEIDSIIDDVIASGGG